MRNVSASGATGPLGLLHRHPVSNVASATGSAGALNTAICRYAHPLKSKPIESRSKVPTETVLTSLL